MLRKYFCTHFLHMWDKQTLNTGCVWNVQVHIMSAVTCQPPPFGPLEREKHIQGIFRAFKNRCGPSCECQTQVEDAKSHRVPPDLESEKHSSDLRPHGGIQDTRMQPPAPKTLEELEQDLNDEAGLQFLSVLETVRQIHVTARPDLQGECGWIQSPWKKLPF